MNKELLAAEKALSRWRMMPIVLAASPEIVEWDIGSQQVKD